MYTQYPTFMPTSNDTQPPVFGDASATDVPTAGGSGAYPTQSTMTTVANTAPPAVEVVTGTPSPTTTGSLQASIGSTSVSSVSGTALSSIGGTDASSIDGTNLSSIGGTSGSTMTMQISAIKEEGKSTRLFASHAKIG